jgi:protocatechuate 3,4-dioxygenase beta subunit
MPLRPEPTAVPATALNRRHALGALGAALGVTAVACSAEPAGSDDTPGGSSSSSSSGSGASSSSRASSGDGASSSAAAGTSEAPSSQATSASSLGNASSTPGSCVLIPTETAGPFPLLAVLSNSAMVRPDMTEGLPGEPMVLRFRVVDVSRGCAPITGAAVYAWQTDKDGAYSGYGAQAGLTWMRGIQPTDSNGVAQFQTIFPGWYPGRIAHVHFQVYLGGPQGTLTATSQLAFPEETATAVYATAPYANRGQNTSVAGNLADGVFRDGVEHQLARMTGSVGSGLTALLDVGLVLP